jgi:Domain of unknown function (DUF1842)
MTDETIVHKAGLFRLNLQSGVPGIVGGVTDSLELLVDTVNNKVTGSSYVFQSTNPPLDVVSHVRGDLIHATVQPPAKSHIVINLEGWPTIDWPSNGGVGPVIIANYSAQISLSTDYQTGIIIYQVYSTRDDAWLKFEQPIHAVK